MLCLNCRSKSIINYGHSRGKQRYFCKKCQKTFTEFSYKGYPPTSVHPLFIALILHRYWDESLKNMTERVNYWLEIFKSHNVSVGTKDKVSMSTVYKWIRNYDEFVNTVSPKQSNRFFRGLLLKTFSDRVYGEPPEPKIVGKKMELTIKGPKSHNEFLKFLQENLSKELFDMLVKDKMILKYMDKEIKQKTIKHEYYQIKYEKRNT